MVAITAPHPSPPLPQEHAGGLDHRDNSKPHRGIHNATMLGGVLRDFDFTSKIKYHDVLDVCLIWHGTGFGSMENTLTGLTDDLPTIVFFLWSQIEKCKQFSPAAGFWPRQYKTFCLPAKGLPKMAFHHSKTTIMVGLDHGLR